MSERRAPRVKMWTLCFATDPGERPVVFRRGEANNPCADCVRVVEAEPVAELLERLYRLAASGAVTTEDDVAALDATEALLSLLRPER